MSMRRFTPEEEQALLFLLAAEGARWRSLPIRPGPDTYQRLARLGCAQLLQDGPSRKGRLSSTGRYFAVLLREAGLVLADPPGMIAARTLPAA